MTAEEFRQWQSQHGLSNQQMADLLGWSREQVKRPPLAEEAMRRLVHRFLLLVDFTSGFLTQNGRQADAPEVLSILNDLEGVEPRPVFSGAEAKRLLSEGQRPADIAKAHGVALQRVSAIARKMREEGVL